MRADRLRRSGARQARGRSVRTAAAPHSAAGALVGGPRQLFELAAAADRAAADTTGDAAIAAAGWAAVAAVAALSLWQMISAFQQAKATIERREEGEREKEREEREAKAEKKRKLDEMFKRL
ncbi:hypothetical protein Rsub_01509 [Raphidocelis subcapitata]|uniref:Uncharacterized protein n=1 Tax=Raphidocelis subcapitata TaxID=307507 RepID=A0A2V0NTW6_9CHLO|nr:hypothetical protein Rsub_01509 [Raphidocelis subcapitata]|eukprot:GBF89010.1 hypothetical protein Rsub_01509 [Raphidocelis subcapitata]